MIHHPKQSGGIVKTTRKPMFKMYTLGLERSRKEISAILEKMTWWVLRNLHLRSEQCLRNGRGKTVVLFEK
jgi:hypothetical protein